MKFLVTEECSRLVRWLRLMGYDTALASPTPLSELYRRAYSEGRIVVTRNQKVGASCLFRVVQLKSELLADQLQQLLQDLRLTLEEDRLFTRCNVCNAVLESVEKSSVKDRVPPYVLTTQQRFYRCPSCQRVYWAATHWQRARRLFDRLRLPAAPDHQRTPDEGQAGKEASHA